MHRKRLNLIIVLLVIVIILANYTAYDKKHVVADNSQIEIDEYKYVDIVYETGIDDKYIEEVDSAVKMLPVCVIENISKEGWKIELEKNISLKGTPYEGEEMGYVTVGMTNYDKKIIEIVPYTYEGISNFVKLRTLHELCHVADKYYGDASEADEWGALYEDYKDRYVEYEFSGIDITPDNQKDIGYATSDRYEMFACVMKDYLNKPEYLLNNYEELYEFFKKLTMENSNDKDT